MVRRKTNPHKKRRSTPRRWASPTRKQWAYSKAFHDAEDRQRKAKKKRRQARRQPHISKAKTKTEMTLMELARSFPDIAKRVSFHPKQYVCSGTCFCTERLIIFLYWSCYLCTKNWRYLSVLEFIFLY